MEEWTKDTIMDNTSLDKESLKIPNLHSKWLIVLSKERQKLKSIYIKRQSLNKVLGEYYRGELNNPEDLEELKREPYPKTVINSLLQQHIDADDEMIKTNLKMAYQQETVDVLDEIMKAINGRQWNIRNAIEWRKFENAVG
jgi:hypothetical protein|tara:strand:+ start:727 stop:1149 length:423 start_codon:yes stop_codon:yes gene_type:complete